MKIDTEKNNEKEIDCFAGRLAWILIEQSKQNKTNIKRVSGGRHGKKH